VKLPLPALIGLILVLGISGCTTGLPPVLSPSLRPVQSETLFAALAAARECSTPVVARVRLSKDFRYGCFCGMGHPAIPTPDGTSLMERVKRYYLIKPIDDTDSICRDHDVCWILRGEGDGDCNDELFERLKYLREGLSDSRSFSDTDNTQFRCEVLALDMRAIFLTVFVESNYASPGKHAGSALARFLLTWTFAPLYGLTRAPLWASDRYPREGERCTLPTAG
jgi:hypothetical protein